MRVLILRPGRMILLPAAESKWLLDESEAVLSMHK